MQNVDPHLIETVSSGIVSGRDGGVATVRVFK